MADYDDTEQDETSESGRNPLRERNRVLEEENKVFRQQAQEALAAQRELAFMKVGINLETPTGKLFAKAYDGEPSPDAIRAAAEEYGLIKAPSPVAADTSEQQAWQRTAASHTSGAPAADAADFEARMRNAQSPDEVQAIFEAARAALMG